MEKIRVRRENGVYIRIDCSQSVALELRDAFKFYVPNAHFSPKFKRKNNPKGTWDGFIKLFNLRTRTIYHGLHARLKAWAHARGYEIEFEDDIDLANEFSALEAFEFYKSLNLPDFIKPREYQLKGFIHTVRDRRVLLESPTSSGKSLMIYLIARYLNIPTLIIVDSTALVLQMLGDFKEYSENDDWHADDHCHVIYEGGRKDSEKQIVISTWQALQREPPEFFDRFQAVIGDEAHHFKATALKGIMENIRYADYRIGTTGTIQDQDDVRLTLEGLFGPIKKLVKTKELMERGQISPLRIKAIVLKYDPETSWQVKKMKYKDEIDFLTGNVKRNVFIRNLAMSLPENENTLILFQYKAHGKALYDMLLNKDSDRNVFLIHGEIPAEARENVRRQTEKTTGNIIVASYGTFSTGTNIKRLHNIIVANPTKSKIRVLQSIGRILRKSEHKTEAVFYDIADDLSSGERRNYVLTHFTERLRVYIKEEFNYKVYKVNMKGKQCKGVV